MDFVYHDLCILIITRKQLDVVVVFLFQNMSHPFQPYFIENLFYGESGQYLLPSKITIYTENSFLNKNKT